VFEHSIDLSYYLIVDTYIKKKKKKHAKR